MKRVIAIQGASGGESAIQPGEVGSALQGIEGGVIITNGTMEMSSSSFAELASTPHDGVVIGVIGNTDNLPDISAENLLASLTGESEWPIGAISAPASLVRKASEKGAQTVIELMATVAMIASLNDEEMTVASLSAENSTSSTSLAQDARARMIRISLEEANVEDLFPSHPWTTHGEESLAASYHSLCASFLKLGDTQSAVECLSISDQFEDSPRSLALKGLIASIQGETLSAVANMVSSLQQYEQRKKNDGSHYLSFSPKSIDTVNSNLKEGLEALNKRDNDKALTCFKCAVFNFDPFYSENGIE